MLAGRLLIALIFVCLVNPSHAISLTWKRIITSDDGLVSFYVESKSIVPHGSMRRVRLLFDFSKVQQDPDTLIEHRSIVELATIDCGRHSLAPIVATSYAENMGRGSAVAVTKSRPPRKLVAAAASIDERIVDFVCKV